MKGSSLNILVRNTYGKLSAATIFIHPGLVNLKANAYLDIFSACCMEKATLFGIKQ